MIKTTHKQHKNNKAGFTIVETMLFLAVSGFVVVGVIVGTSSSIARQRYQDSVQDFAEFLRKTYSEVINVQNSRTNNTNNICTIDSIIKNPTLSLDVNPENFPGKSDCAIYGKMLVVKDHKIRSYTLLGKAINSTDKTAINLSTPEAIKELGIDALTIQKNSDNTCSYKTINSKPAYRPQWDAKIQNTMDQSSFSGTILILRSPLSGAVHTFNLKDNISFDLDELEKENLDCAKTDHKVKLKNKTLSSILSESKPEDTLKSEDIDFCLKSSDFFLNSDRRNIRIKKGGHNSSSVEIVSADTNIFTIDKDKTKGNRCL